MTPLVSVVIPFFRNDRFLVACLESVMAQTQHGLEVILVDDCSPVTPDLSRFARSRFPLQVERTGRNSGPGAARNLGVRNARGEWIAFLDADDAWLPGKIEKQLRLALEPPGVDWVFTDARHWIKGRVFRRTFSQLYGFRRGMPEGPEVHRQHLEGKSFITPSTVMIRREAFIASGGFDERMRVSEDWEFFTRLAASSPPRCVQEALTIYRVTPEGHHYRHLKEFQELNEAILRQLHRSAGSDSSLELGLFNLRRHSAVQYLNAGKTREARSLLFSGELPSRWSRHVMMLKAFSIAPQWSYRTALRLLSRLP